MRETSTQTASVSVSSLSAGLSALGAELPLCVHCSTNLDKVSQIACEAKNVYTKLQAVFHTPAMRVPGSVSAFLSTNYEFQCAMDFIERLTEEFESTREGVIHVAALELDANNERRNELSSNLSSRSVGGAETVLVNDARRTTTPLPTHAAPNKPQLWQSDSTASLSATKSIEELIGQLVTDESGNIAICEYEVIAELGRGNFGVVVLAVPAAQPCEAVAIKSLHRRTDLSSLRRASHTASDSDYFADCPSGPTIEHEVALMKKMRHRNLVRLHAVIEDVDNQQVHLVMQYIENGPIAKLSREGSCTPLPVADVLHYMTQVSAGIDYLHRRGILHRDIKPENILIGKNRTAYVADFGVSAVIEEVAGAGVRTGTAGTLSFFSPELLSERDAIVKFGKECDVWAFGVTLYVLLYGTLPFGGWNQHSLMRSILNDEIPFPSTGDIPVAVQGLVKELLVRDPTKRLSLSEFRSRSALLLAKSCAIAHNDVNLLAADQPEYKRWDDEDSDEELPDRGGSLSVIPRLPSTRNGFPINDRKAVTRASLCFTSASPALHQRVVTHQSPSPPCIAGRRSPNHQGKCSSAPAPYEDPLSMDNDSELSEADQRLHLQPATKTGARHHVHRFRGGLADAEI